MKDTKDLVAELEVITDEAINNLTEHNENTPADMLSTREKFAVLIFRELAQAINGTGRTLVLDANYAKSGFHNKTEKQLAKGQCNQWLVDYYRVIDDAGDSMIQVYTKLNPKTGDASFDLCTSCAAVNRMQFEMEEELGFVIQRRPNGDARTSRKNDIGYGALPEVIARTLAVLAEGERQKIQVKEEKQKAKEEAKKKKAEERAAAKEAKAKEEPKEEEPKPEVKAEKKTTAQKKPAVKKNRNKKKTEVA